MHIIFKTGLYFFLLLSASLPLQAEEQAATEESQPVKKQYYIVEVVLFKHLNEQGKRDEFWSRPEIFDNSVTSSDFSNSSSESIITDDSPALAEYDLQSRRFSPLRNGIAKTSSEKYKLSDSAAHLRYSPDYKLLAHFGWTQRSISRNRALPIRITSNEFSDGLNPSGEIKLYVSRYLHMVVDLKASQCDASSVLNDTGSDKALDKQLENGTSSLETQSKFQNENIADNQCTNKVYQFKQNRKMRSRELHYIDNPVFGMLVYVTPFTVN